jgi:hypothetical protein
MNEIITSFIDFMNTNYKFIIAMILSIFGLLVFISVKDINLNVPKKQPKLAQSVTVETFDSLNVDNITQSEGQGEGEGEKADVNDNALINDIIPVDGISNFCSKYSESPKELEDACNGLAEATCKNISCCALIGNSAENDKSKCSAANKSGPIYKSDATGKLISMDHYYYEGTKYNLKQ